ncbi:MAG TPA: hypothetical protein VGP79_13775 [Bryobacteraceae bacterium]|jgi:hypothetical protein|nr:hypothetical protein [Bryobacteraceae bacterium]
MSEPTDVVVVEIPARIADLAFRIAVPRDWNLPELPAEEVDFSSPGTFFPLMLAVAPWAAVVLTVAARPGFENGTLQDWSLFLLDSQGIRPTAFGPAAIGNLQGLAGVGRQQQEDTWLEVRFAFFEDGGRLVYLGLLAPEAISGSLEPVWTTALQSFVVERPQGQNVPLGPGEGIAPEPVADADSAPTVEANAATGPAEPIASQEPASPQAASPQPRQFTESDLGHYAKSNDLNTLDPENPINARLRDQGVGFVPNVLETDQEAKTARLGAGAIQALIRVALGWHVIDDGRRTMVLDPDGKIQINLSVILKEGRNIDQILDDIQTQTAQDYANPQFLRAQDGGIWGLAIRGIVVNNEPVEQVHMLTTWGKDSAMLRARVTSDPQSMRFAANYADLILKSADYGHRENDNDADSEQPDTPTGGPQDSSSNEPEWMRRARQLEREDRLEEAEQVIRDSIPSLHFAIATAEMYRTRWIRLQESDSVRAGEARKQAAHWAYTYASFATSGGEGEALSQERDDFLRLLGPEPLE